MYVLRSTYETDSSGEGGLLVTFKLCRSLIEDGTGLLELQSYKFQLAMRFGSSLVTCLARRKWVNGFYHQGTHNCVKTLLPLRAYHLCCL